MQFLFYDPSLNLTCQVWYKYKLHLVTLSNTPTRTWSQGSADQDLRPIIKTTLAQDDQECICRPIKTGMLERETCSWSGEPWLVNTQGQSRLQNTHFWAIRLTKLLLGHCGSFKVIVIEQFVWIETKTRSISIDFVLTVSNSENQIFLYLLLSSSESIIFLIDSTLNLWPWSSIWATDLSLRSILPRYIRTKIVFDGLLSSWNHRTAWNNRLLVHYWNQFRSFGCRMS